MRLLICFFTLLLTGCAFGRPLPIESREVTDLWAEPAAVAAGATTRLIHRYRNDADTLEIPNMSHWCSAGTLYAVSGDELTVDGVLPTQAELDARVQAAELPDQAHSGQRVSGSVMNQYYWVAPAEPGTYELAADMKGAFHTGEIPDKTISILVQ